MLPLLYIDPGTGSLLLYALIGITATVCFSLRGLWYNFKGIFYKGSSKYSIPKNLPDLVIHSEGARYWHVFEPLLKELNKRNIKFAYVTSDEKDYILSRHFENAVPVRPGKDLATISYMNSIKAKLVITTTPHLDIYMMKKSKKVEKYIYIFHAPTAVESYEKYAFNRYDAVFCNTRFSGEQIRELERKRNLPEKELFYTGCTYYDYMLEEKENIEKRLYDKSNSADSFLKNKTEKTVLYAPTWGDRSSVLKYGKQILETLSESDCRVLFRPHPQFYVSHSEIIKDIEDFISASSNIILDKKQTAMDSMAEADVLISDNSGILFDYAYIYEKPILFINVKPDMKGFEGEDLEIFWDIENCKKLSREITEDDFFNINEIIEQVISSKEKQKETVKKLRDEELLYFGKSAEIKADKIEELLRA